MTEPLDPAALRDASDPIARDADLAWAATAAPAAALPDRDADRRRDRVARLVARLYRGAAPARRAQVLAGLLRPLGTLGVAAVAAGAFGAYLHRRAAADPLALAVDAARHTREQVQALVRFVQEVDPEALQPLADALAGDALGMAGFGAAAAALLYRLLHGDRNAPAATAR